MEKYSDRLNEMLEKRARKFNFRFKCLCSFVKSLPENIVFDLGFYEPGRKLCFCPCHKNFRHERKRISGEMQDYMEQKECTKGRMDSVGLLQHLHSRQDMAHRAAYFYLCKVHNIDPDHVVSTIHKQIKHFDIKTNR